MDESVYNINANQFPFGGIDYGVFVVMLGASVLIGVYFGYCGKGEDTTDEYLLGGKKLKTFPIAISLMASQLSSLSIMTTPAEMYSFGLQYALVIPAMIFVTLIICYVLVPVFYDNNISNCYEYLEMRFDKRIRQLVTLSFITTVYLILPVIIFVPALAFAQVTGINIHLINGVVCSVCVFYTMLGGIKAVVWTDVLQAGIMFGSCILVAIMGVIKIGGFGEVWTRASEGNRLNIFNMDLNPAARTTFWNSLFGSIFMWTGYLGLNQSCVQRIVALPSLGHARKALAMFCVGFFIIMCLNCFAGIAMFARYYMCDPIKVKIVEKADKLMPFFVQDVVGHLKGMPGVFISCVFSAALSTMSANMNSLSGIIYFDYVRPFVNHTESKANLIMKLLVAITGCYCVVAGIVVEKFTSILQMVITMYGVTQGAVVGVFTLGMLYPKANAKSALAGTIFSIIIMAWIIGGNQKAIANGEVVYNPLPTRTDGCDAFNITVPEQITSSLSALAQNSTSDEDSFSFYKISFNWYSVMGTLLVWIAGVPLSYIIGNDPKRKIKMNLISPIAYCLVPKEHRHLELPQREQLLKLPEFKDPIKS